MLRFVLGMRRRCEGDVSTMDTSDPAALSPRPAVGSRATALPGIPPEHTSDVRRQKTAGSQEPGGELGVLANLDLDVVDVADEHDLLGAVVLGEGGQDPGDLVVGAHDDGGVAL